MRFPCLLGWLAILASTVCPDAAASPSHVDQYKPPFLSTFWNMAHHDIRNTGRANFVGPADEPTTCDQNIVDPNTSKGEYYTDTGSISLNNTHLYVGTSINTIEVFNVETLKQQTFALGGGGQHAILSPPTIWPVEKSGETQEHVFFGSTDGYVYDFNAKACRSSHVSKPCLVWNTKLGNVEAPVRLTWIQEEPKKYPNGILLASTTDVYDDVDGTLYALNVDDGSHVWPDPINAQFQRDIGNTTVSYSYGLHYTPAIDFSLDETIAIIGYGPLLRGISLVKGTDIDVVQPFDISGGGEITEVIHSSPSVTESLTNPSVVYFQTESDSGTALWAVEIVPSASSFIGEFQMKWRCEYVHEDKAGIGPLTATCTTPTQMQKLWAASRKSLQEKANTIAQNGGDVEQWALKSAYHPLTAHQMRSVNHKDAPVAISGATLTLGTPSLMVDFSEIEDRVVVALTDVTAGFRPGVVCVSTATGAVVWDFQASSDGKALYGNSRSSPAIDSLGNVYVVSDAEIDGQPFPVLFAIREGIADTANLAWYNVIGNAGQKVGYISPVVAHGPRGEKRVYASTMYNHKIISEGCPSNTAGEECSGHGHCPCDLTVAPKCECTGCYVGDMCTETTQCSGHGNCINDQCECDSNWYPVGSRKVECAECDFCGTQNGCTPNKCSGHGTCRYDVCFCDAGWQGDYCDQKLVCPSGSPRPTKLPRPSPSTIPAPSSGAYQPASTPSSHTGDYVAGFGIPLLILGFCAFVVGGWYAGWFAGSRFGSRMDKVGANISERLSNLNARAPATFSTSQPGSNGEKLATSSSGYGATHTPSKPSAYSQL